MTFTALTLFPEILEAYFRNSVLARSIERGIIRCRAIDIRDFATDKHRKCDDAPYGGGAGMLLLPEPLAAALDAVGADSRRTVYVTPSGKPFDQAYARDLAGESELVIICGRYEGIDQRIIDAYVDDEISIGDYVLSSGEIAALTVIDAVYRLVEGVISGLSLSSESFEDGLLEYPQYTRPESFRGMRVPEVLLSGHHEKIRKWRLERKLEKTLKFRPDFLEKRAFSIEENELMERIRSEGGDNGFRKDDRSVANED